MKAIMLNRTLTDDAIIYISDDKADMLKEHLSDLLAFEVRSIIDGAALLSRLERGMAPFYISIKVCDTVQIKQCYISGDELEYSAVLRVMPESYGAYYEVHLWAHSREQAIQRAKRIINNRHIKERLLKWSVVIKIK